MKVNFEVRFLDEISQFFVQKKKVTAAEILARKIFIGKEFATRLSKYAFPIIKLKVANFARDFSGFEGFKTKLKAYFRYLRFSYSFPCESANNPENMLENGNFEGFFIIL